MRAKLIFFGTEDFSAPVLKALIKAGFAVVGVVTKPDSKRGRGRKSESPQVKSIAIRRGIKVFQPASFAGFADQLKAAGADLGVLAAYGKILPKSILSSFRLGIINLHPSKLPLYRGPSPIESVILDGKMETAVTLIKLTEGMDAGPIYSQQKVEIGATPDRLRLSRMLSALGAVELVRVLPKIIEGALRPRPQNHAKATYTRLVRKEDGRIEWSLPAKQIERQVRAYLGWPGTYTEIFDVRITILEAGVADIKGPTGEHFVSSQGELGIYCGQGGLLIRRLRPAGRRGMSAAEFIRGYNV